MSCYTCYVSGQIVSILILLPSAFQYSLFPSVQLLHSVVPPHCPHRHLLRSLFPPQFHSKVSLKTYYICQIFPLQMILQPQRHITLWKLWNSTLPSPESVYISILRDIHRLSASSFRLPGSPIFHFLEQWIRWSRRKIRWRAQHFLDGKLLVLFCFVMHPIQEKV